MAIRSLPPVRAFETHNEARIYQIPLQEFPMLTGYAYIVLTEHQGQAYRVLIDTGSGFGECNHQLEAGLASASELAKEPVNLGNLTHVLITHGHIDHFGGLTYVRDRTPALVGVHELDLRNLTNYEERLVVVSRRLDNFLVEAGVHHEERRRLIDMYMLTKNLYHSVHVDFTYEAIGLRLGPFNFLHTPGHCAGHVVIRLEDVLFSGDQVLEEISPHQSPEHITLSTGLEHYLRSLEQLEDWASGVSLVLGGHKDPIHNLSERIHAIRNLHHQRLEAVLELLNEPHTTAHVAAHLFGSVNGYNVLLALEEAGAHVEYLYQRGLLAIANIKEVENSQQLGPVLYQRLKQ